MQSPEISMEGETDVGLDAMHFLIWWVVFIFYKYEKWACKISKLLTMKKAVYLGVSIQMAKLFSMALFWTQGGSISSSL